MNAEDFRRLALSLPGTEESSHMGAADFRVGRHIFATLAHAKQGYGNLMLSPELQRDFIADLPDVFLPVKGGWGRNGATHVRLDRATEDVLHGALHAAWKLRMEKNRGGKEKPPRKNRNRTP
ncbi:MAG: MmcQ/YjbR family DNA-binding protein [Acidobacteriales bacterium]|nr:MmcQ/YjbR family DNA-binding protein [Terriglobales bacterium]